MRSRVSLNPRFIFILLPVSLILWWNTGGERSYQTAAFVYHLRHGDARAARRLMTFEQADQNAVLRHLDNLDDERLYMAALDAVYVTPGNFPDRAKMVEREHRNPTAKQAFTEALVRRGARPHYRHLYEAVMDPTAAFYLMDHGTAGDLSPVTGNGNALTMASYTNHGEGSRLARRLIALGADVNAPDDSQTILRGVRPLEAAVMTRNAATVAVLLENGADPMAPRGFRVGADSPVSLPIWKVARSMARTEAKKEPPTPVSRAAAVWERLKPVVEKRLGHPVED